MEGDSGLGREEERRGEEMRGDERRDHMTREK